MSELKRIIILKDGEYILGYRKKMVSNSTKLEEKEKCLKSAINFDYINRFKKETIKEVIKTWNFNRKSIYVPQEVDLINASMEGLKKATKKEQIGALYNDYICAIFEIACEATPKNKDEIEKFSRELLKIGIFYPDLANSIFVKYVVKNYYRNLLNNLSNDLIDEIEISKTTGYDDEKCLDNIMGRLNEEAKDFKSKDLYSFSKMVVNDEIDKTYARKFVNLCGDHCPMKYFNRCAKIYPTFYGISPAESYEELHDLTRFPFVKNGYQVEKYAFGKWSIEEVCVSKCDMLHNDKIESSKRLELFKKNTN